MDRYSDLIKKVCQFTLFVTYFVARWSKRAITLNFFLSSSSPSPPSFSYQQHLRSEDPSNWDNERNLPWNPLNRHQCLRWTLIQIGLSTKGPKVASEFLTNDTSPPFSSFFLDSPKETSNFIYPRWLWHNPQQWSFKDNKNISVDMLYDYMEDTSIYWRDSLPTFSSFR
jgi:hypothetical protein